MENVIIEIKADKELGPRMVYVVVNGEVVLECLNDEEVSEMTVKEIIDSYRMFTK